MDTKSLQENMVVFLDAIGRVIVGEQIKERETESDLVVKNPIIVHVEPKNGNIAIQFFPIFFKEFLGSKDDASTFTFKKSNLSVMDKCVLDFKLYAQYAQMFSANGSPQTQNTQQSNNQQPEVIKLFED
jgi:hypothetical protein